MKKLIWFGCLTISLSLSGNLWAKPQPRPYLRMADNTQTSQAAAEGLVQFSDLLLRLGNLRQNDLVFGAFQKLIEQRIKAGEVEPKVANLLELLLYKTRLMGGQVLLARQKGDQLLSWAQEQPDSEEVLEVYASLLLAAYKGGLPDVTDKYLAAFQAAVEKAPPDKAPIWRFFSQSFTALQAIQKDPSISVANLCSRHDQTWKNLTALKEATNRPHSGRIVAELSRLWLEELCASYRDHQVAKDSPDEKLLSDSIGLEAEQLVRMLSIVRPGEMQDFEQLPWAFHLCGYLVEVHRQGVALHLDDTDDTLKALNELEPIFVKQEPGLLQVERDVQKQLPAELLVLLPKGFKLSVTSGDWSLTRMQMRQAQLLNLLYLHPGKLNAEQLKTARKLGAEAIKLNQHALEGVGYQGYGDPRWTVLELLLAQRPKGWEKEAETWLGQLRETNQRLNHREGTVRALTLTAELQMAQGQLAGATSTLQAATETVEKYVQEVGASAAGSERIRSKYKRAYQLLTQLQISQGKTDQAFQTLSRQQELEAAQQNQESLRDNRQLKAVQKVRGDMAVLEQQLTADRSLGRDSQGTEQLLAQNKGEFQRVVADLRSSHPQYEAAMAVRPVEFLELKKSIPADTTAVLYFHADDGLYIFVASRDNDLKIHKVSVTARDLQKSVLRTRQLITSFLTESAFGGHPENFRWNDPASPGYQKHTQPLKLELSRLHHWLIEPIEKDLQGRPVLAVVPGGILHYVPYPALCKLDAQGEPHFLAEQQQCVNLVKTSDLIPRGSEKKGRLLYALGNPDGSLPGAEREVKSIARSFPNSRQFVGAEASAAKLRKLEPDTGYVHLATHGELSGSDPKNSYLVMAGKGEEGKFRATDIYDLEWQGVRLVTLSACKTALQEGNPGAAITNLAEAFRVAGGQSVVASLWSVADEATEKLMIEFYQGLAQGKSLAAALQQAELNVAKQPGLAHPYFWASFTLFGDWR
ncbi:CHAT domain-containing protein [bacterium]|nr:CHAT domain-containing protein [bacterium]